MWNANPFLRIREWSCRPAGEGEDAEEQALMRKAKVKESVGRSDVQKKSIYW